MRFHSKPIEEHAEVPLADAGRWEALVERWSQQRHDQGDERTQPRDPDKNTHTDPKPCYVLSIQRTGHGSDAGRRAQLDEIVGLVDAQGDFVVGRDTYLLSRPDPRTLIGRGVAERVGTAARESGATMLVVDAELTPSQARNLEDATGVAVCDREAVILNVFQRHATTRRARMQVEIAHLEYLRPRIRGIGLNMDQQAGGMVNSRGAGETASELLARRLDGRLADLRHGLVALKRADSAQRKQRAACQRVVLVGYTNAGKTSLMNGLTAETLSVRARPFETLDTTSRCLTRHGGDVLLSDTVGFIRRLPERLFASFESTLAEVSTATLLVLVVDASDVEMELHLQTTEGMLSKLGASSIRRVVVFNKIDRWSESISTDRLRTLSGGHPFVALSSHDLTAVGALRDTLVQMVRHVQRKREIFVRYGESALTDAIYRSCRVVNAVASQRGTQFVIEGEPHVVDAIAHAARKVNRS